MIRSAVFMDLGSLTSVGASLMVARLYAKTQRQKCFFVTTKENLRPQFLTEDVLVIDIDDLEKKLDLFQSLLVIDFTAPGKGLARTALLFQESYNFFLQQEASHSQNSFAEKVEYVETVTGSKHLLLELPETRQTPVLTFSPEMAVLLNLQGIPTIELCYRFKAPGSFLPRSLIVFGDTFSLLRKDEIQLLFEFYQNGRIEDIFVNKNVLEIDWDLLYFKMDRKNQSIHTHKYPVSPTEAFLDQFLRSFLSQPGSKSYSLDEVMMTAQKLDTLDLDVTLEFLRKTLKRCLLDLDKKVSPLTQAHWNWIRPYADCYTKTKFQELKTLLQQAVLGVELFGRIQERQKRVVGMH